MFEHEVESHAGVGRLNGCSGERRRPAIAEHDALPGYGDADVGLGTHRQRPPAVLVHDRGRRERPRRVERQGQLDAGAAD